MSRNNCRNPIAAAHGIACAIDTRMHVARGLARAGIQLARRPTGIARGVHPDSGQQASAWSTAMTTLVARRSLVVTTSTRPIEQASRLLYAARLRPILVARDRFLVTASTCPIEQASRLLYAARLRPILVARDDRLWSQRQLAQWSRRAACSTRPDCAPSWLRAIAFWSRRQLAQ